MIRLDTMLAFTRVAELHSFTAAADSLGLPKSTVSSAVMQLESHLKTQLLYRTTRKVQLTHDGQAFYQRAKDILADMDEAEAMFQTAPAALDGRLRIDMPVHMARNLVIPRLPGFLAQHPGLDIELSCTDRRVDVVAEGFDCVIRVGQMADSGLTARAIGELRMANIASAAYVQAYGLPQTLDDLARHRMVHYVSHLGNRPDGFEYFDGESYRCIPVPGQVFVDNTLAYQSAVVAGLGIIQAPRISLLDHVRAGALVEVLPQYVAQPLPVSLVYPQRRHPARRVRAFMDWVAALLDAYIRLANDA